MSAIMRWDDKKLRARVYAASSDAAYATALDAASISSSSMKEGTVTGRVRGRNKYRAAPYGSPPGIRTGRLRRSITAERVGHTSARYGTNVHYGRYHELGYVVKTRGGLSHIPARPFLRPVLKNNAQRLHSVYVDEFRRAMGTK